MISGYRGKIIATVTSSQTKREHRCTAIEGLNLTQMLKLWDFSQRGRRILQSGGLNPMKSASFIDFTGQKFFVIITKPQSGSEKQVVDGDWELLKCVFLRCFISSQHVGTAATKERRPWNASKTPVWNIPKVNRLAGIKTLDLVSSCRHSHIFNPFLSLDSHIKLGSMCEKQIYS